MCQGALINEECTKTFNMVNIYRAKVLYHSANRINTTNAMVYFNGSHNQKNMMNN